ncbi:MAG: type III-A CRISPR-associated protein Csm2 [Candidatus Caenarcaniphilales bacterium]|nr:type III-A CRISPR-associated protein Csm2 [Candidatus Caenarcaniphilales bacterium]
MAKVLNESIIEAANKIGSDLKDAEFTTSQLRKFFAQVCAIQSQAGSLKSSSEREEKWARLKTKVLMLEPRLGYQIQKLQSNDKDKLKDLFLRENSSFKRLLNESKDSPEDFLTFSAFVEAVVAYHRSHGGKEK